MYKYFNCINPKKINIKTKNLKFLTICNITIQNLNVSQSLNTLKLTNIDEFDTNNNNNDNNNNHINVNNLILINSFHKIKMINCSKLIGLKIHQSFKYYHNIINSLIFNNLNYLELKIDNGCTNSINTIFSYTKLTYINFVI